jgi:Phage integrase family
MAATKREGDMTTIIGLAPDVGNFDRRAALVLGAAAASGIGAPAAHAQGAEGAIKTYNPTTVAAELGPYSHAVEVPPNARWLYIAGQIGNTPDGSMVPEHGARGMSPGAVQVWFHRLYQDLGFAGASSHSGRRTFITRTAKKIVEAGGSLRDVQELAGHTSLSTTQRYIQGDTAAKRRVVDL